MSRAGPRLRGLCRDLVVAGVRFTAERPLLRRSARAVAAIAPGLKMRLIRRLETGVSAPADPNERYVFRPCPVEDDGEGPVTVEFLHALSREI